MSIKNEQKHPHEVVPPVPTINIVPREELERHYVCKEDLSYEVGPIKTDIALIKKDVNLLRDGQINMDYRFDIIEEKLDEFMFSQLAVAFVKAHWKGIVALIGSIITMVLGAIGVTQI